LEKIKSCLNSLLSQQPSAIQLEATQTDSGLSLLPRTLYEACLYEVCVQICLLKPTLLTRLDDLVANAKEVVESCAQIEEFALKQIPTSSSSSHLTSHQSVSSLSAPLRNKRAPSSSSSTPPIAATNVLGSSSFAINVDPSLVAAQQSINKRIKLEHADFSG
jgi:hypothetical protein